MMHVCSLSGRYTNSICNEFVAKSGRKVYPGSCYAMPQQALRTAPPAAESVEVGEVKTQETHQAPQRGNAEGIPGHCKRGWLENPSMKQR